MRPEIEIVCEVSDGLEAVQKAQELKPDLVLLDIGLPKLNGIEVARLIRQVSPGSKIIFISQDDSPDVVQEALKSGGQAYVYKARAGKELLPAVDAVISGDRFVSSSLKGYELTNIPETNLPHHHEILFYSNDAAFVDRFTLSIAAALNAGNAAVVNVSKQHLDALIPRLKAECADLDLAMQQGTFISLNAVDTISNAIVNDSIDSFQFLKRISGLIQSAAKATKA
ncbi:MAG TPA: response regulator transcription factor, partial [Candidatus Acidoferrales bacterium]